VNVECYFVESASGIEKKRRRHGWSLTARVDRRVARTKGGLDAFTCRNGSCSNSASRTFPSRTSIYNHQGFFHHNPPCHLPSCKNIDTYTLHVFVASHISSHRKCPVLQPVSLCLLLLEGSETNLSSQEPWSSVTPQSKPSSVK
jgi:hypothetical protein